MPPKGDLFSSFDTLELVQAPKIKGSAEFVDDFLSLGKSGSAKPQTKSSTGGSTTKNKLVEELTKTPQKTKQTGPSQTVMLPKAKAPKAVTEPVIKTIKRTKPRKPKASSGGATSGKITRGHGTKKYTSYSSRKLQPEIKQVGPEIKPSPIVQYVPNTVQIKPITLPKSSPAPKTAPPLPKGASDIFQGLTGSGKPDSVSGIRTGSTGKTGTNNIIRDLTDSSQGSGSKQSQNQKQNQAQKQNQNQKQSQTQKQTQKQTKVLRQKLQTTPPPFLKEQLKRSKKPSVRTNPKDKQSGKKSRKKNAFTAWDIENPFVGLKQFTGGRSR